MGKHNLMSNVNNFPDANRGKYVKAKTWQCGLCGEKREYEVSMPFPGICTCGSQFWGKMQ